MFTESLRYEIWKVIYYDLLNELIRNVTDNHDSYSPKKLILSKYTTVENQQIPNLSNKSNNYLIEYENVSNRYKLDSDEDRLIVRVLN